MCRIVLAFAVLAGSAWAEKKEKPAPPYKLELAGKDGKAQVITNLRKATAAFRKATFDLKRDPMAMFEAKLTINGSVFVFTQVGDANNAVLAILRAESTGRRSRITIGDLGDFNSIPEAPPTVGGGAAKPKLSPQQAQAMLQMRVKQEVSRHVLRYGRPPSPQSMGLIWRNQYRKAMSEGWWPKAQPAPKPMPPKPGFKPADKPSKEQIAEARKKARIDSMREMIYPALRKGRLLTAKPAEKKP